MSTMSTNATNADVVSDPPSRGPTASSPYGTASTAGGPPELSLPPPSLKERRVSTELMVFLDPASGQPSPVRDLSKSCDLNADVDADADDSDEEDWVAEPDGSFSPKRKESASSAWKPSSLMRLERSLPALRKSLKLPGLLILVSILLGPNLALISYLCGVSSPSGSAHLAGKSHRLHAADTWQAKARPEPSRQFPGRRWEATGDGFWLLPFALWKHPFALPFALW
jgi:hypothetical protein